MGVSVSLLSESLRIVSANERVWVSSEQGSVRVAGFLHRGSGEPGRNSLTFYDPALEVIHHYSCHILLVTQVLRSVHIHGEVHSLQFHGRCVKELFYLIKTVIILHCFSGQYCLFLLFPSYR